MQKNYNEFLLTLEDDTPDENWSEVLKSLWYDAKGDWHAAHDIVDSKQDELAKWIHAYLHRKEGDMFNAKYWYRQAGKTFSTISLEDEHREIVVFILLNDR